MRRRHLVAVAVVVLVGAVVSAAWAQGWGRGCGARWSSMSQEDRQKTADLHQKIRTAQWQLFSLQQSGGDQEKTSRKQKEVTDLRARLHKVMAATRPSTCPWTGQACMWPDCPRGAGMGAGRGMGMGRGRGMGAGRGAGGACPNGYVCPWTQPPATAQPQ